MHRLRHLIDWFFADRDRGESLLYIGTLLALVVAATGFEGMGFDWLTAGILGAVVAVVIVFIARLLGEGGRQDDE